MTNLSVLTDVLGFTSPPHWIPHQPCHIGWAGLFNLFN